MRIYSTYSFSRGSSIQVMDHLGRLDAPSVEADEVGDDSNGFEVVDVTLPAKKRSPDAPGGRMEADPIHLDDPVMEVTTDIAVKKSSKSHPPPALKKSVTSSLSSSSPTDPSTVLANVAPPLKKSSSNTSAQTFINSVDHNHTWLALPKYTHSLARKAVKPAPWKCDFRKKDFSPTVEQSQRTIYSFVHIFKCSGSTIRDFFLRYADVCHRGWTLLIHCTDADPDSIESGKEWRRCMRKLAISRKDGRIVGGSSEEEQKVDSLKIQQGVDIFGGHFKIGIGNYLKNPVQYLTFLREPMNKYVSSRIFVNRNMTKDWIMSKIKKDVIHERQLGKYYMRIDDYLLTPFETPAMKDASVQEKALLVVGNLLKYNVVIGLTEAMGDSMEIYQHIFDPQKEMGRLFEQYGMIGEGSKMAHNATSSTVRNKSLLSSSEMLAELQQDDDFFHQFVEYVKYEKWIYDVGMKMHQVQLEVTRQ